MITAIIFDLDGTLVKTEQLKAISYARAAVELCPRDITEEEVVDAFKSVVGRSRREVATALVERFELERVSSALMEDYKVKTPWQAFVQLRLDYYEEMISDPQLIRENQWPHTRQLLHKAREWKCATALATMSGCERTTLILDVLELAAAFDFIATRDDVENGKPDPEIYNLISQELDIPPEQCMVVEDSPAGVKAALAANMACIAVTTPFTREHIHEQGLLDPRWIVDDATTLPQVVQQMFTERKQAQS
jgi:beta-phosphoglucomutase